MKELSIEEKAKAYDEALRYAMIYYKEGNEDMKMMMKTCFPALVEESEDERIRKEIINYFAKGKEYLSLCSIGKDDILAWLEKQVEKPSVIRWYNVSLIPQEMEELLVEWDSEDATWHEIAFYHADTKTFWNGTKQVENVTRWCYIIDLLEKQGESSDKIHYWTEEEIEPIISDYLRGAEHYGGMIGRLRCLKPKSLERQGDSPIKWDKNTEGNKPQVNHSVLMKTTHGIAEGEWKGEYWHQYRWAGIVRDSDVLSWMELSDLEKQGEQKPAWSEKDEKEYKYVLKFVDNILNNCGNKKDYEHCKRCYDWLKSLKQRIGG